MNARQLNELFDLYQDGKFKYADIDAKSVYDNCINISENPITYPIKVQGNNIDFIISINVKINAKTIVIKNLFCIFNFLIR